MHQRQTKYQNIDKPINIQNGVVLEEDTVWKCVFNLVYVHDNSKGKDRGLKNQGYGKSCISSYTRIVRTP